MTPRRVEIVAGESIVSTPSSLRLDGVDITQYVRGFTVRARVGEPTVVELELLSGVSLTVDGVVVPRGEVV